MNRINDMTTQQLNPPSWPVTRLILVRPAQFGFNPENTDNGFAHKPVATVQMLALQEFDAVCLQLEHLGLDLWVLADQSQSPDAIFPNNWCSLHADGKVFFYPMKSPLRRSEVRPGFVQELTAQGLQVENSYDWSGWAERDRYLEGTGSMVLDPLHRVAYVGISERSDLHLAKQFCDEMAYELLAFHSQVPSTASRGSVQAAYHTNVLMSIGLGFVIWCPEALPFLEERERLLARFQQDELTPIALSIAQVQAFAGNMLQVQTPQGPCLLMSQSAYESLTPAQIQQLKTFTRLHSFAIPTLEKVGGGSIRCMILENPLPLRFS